MNKIKPKYTDKTTLELWQMSSHFSGRKNPLW